MKNSDRAELLERLEDYYDAVPRSAARAEDFGALTLFVRERAGMPYYARPARKGEGEAGAADVLRVRERQRELGVPEAFEWIAETTPWLRAAVEAAGLEVHEHPLMVLDGAGPAADDPRVRIVDPDDPVLPSATALLHLAFGDPGTAIGAAGAGELAAKIAELGDGPAEETGRRMRAGVTVLAAATENGVALCSGQHQPVGTVSEIVGVGTLPSRRREGMAYAVTAVLVADARARGVETIFLSAGDADVARMYGRLGFRTIGTALIAES
ncbi:GNAT family N-acetyltransferase [Actinocorallia longicatena]|uniref:GCN5-related N-acetyltransferase Rv2170-like domain-containing protein n=1 Tax=Actinocorallia longicatena TaxID=111803 RepID=A0ABP6PW19_9ACTN